MLEPIVRVHVSLQGSRSDRHHFLRAFGVVLEDGTPKPIDYEEHRYLFSHTLVTPGYGSNASETIYVFREDASVRPG